MSLLDLTLLDNFTQICNLDSLIGQKGDTGDDGERGMVLYEADYQGTITDPYQIESGLMAQDILKIPGINYTVSGGDYFKDDQKISKAYSVKYNDLFVYNIAATKEVDVKNKHLQDEIDKLNYQLSEMTTMNKKILNSFNIANKNYQTLIEDTLPIFEQNKQLIKKIDILSKQVDWCQKKINNGY